MRKLGGFRGLAIAVIAVLAGIALPASSVDLPLPQAPQAELTSATSSQQVMVCVDWETKEVKYSKYWRFCPNKHSDIMLGVQGPQGETGLTGPRGPSGGTGATGARGPAGATTSLWDSLNTCYQKVQAAIDAGYRMVLKSDREAFESASGCIVENSFDTSKQALYDNMGIPYLSNVELIEVLNAVEGDGGPFNSIIEGRRAEFRFTISNADALSAVQDFYRFCILYSGYSDDLTGKITLDVPAGGVTSAILTLGAQTTKLELNLKLGYQDWNTTTTCRSFGHFSQEPDIVYLADPNVWPSEPFLTYWGW